MGRHSAPDSDADDAVAAETAQAAGAAEAPDAGISGPSRESGAEGASTASAASSPGRADLDLLRTDAWLRVRCLGAVVLIFAVYTAVLLLIGRRDVYLIWLWIPIVGSGVAIGGFLDAAHRARTR